MNRTAVIDFPYDLDMGGDNKKFMGGYKRKLPYKTMSDDEILRFDIDRFLKPRACLFVWTTSSKIQLAIEYLKKYGFKLHSVITWVKNGGPTMNGIHNNSELVLFGYRGSWQIPINGKAIRTAFASPRRGHSVKPREFYEMIRPKTPAPRIDIFARGRHPGFAAWGDEVEQ